MREAVDHMVPGAPEKLGAPGPTWNLSFVFMYYIWNCKSRKNWIRSVYSNWNDSKIMFGPKV